MKIVLLENVKRDNVAYDGKLEAGIYNVAYDGVMSFMPMHRGFDGNKWDEDSDFWLKDIGMTVFVRVADYGSKGYWNL